MQNTVTELLGELDQRVEDMMSACTRCGQCVEVCPMPGPGGIDASDSGGVMTGVLALLREGRGPQASERWAEVCSGSGFCIEACGEGVNPRFLLAMARRVIAKRDAPPDRRASGRAQFKKMSRGVRVLSRLQLPPELLDRLSPASHPERAAPPDVVFYTGCNLLKTPHIGLLCLDILDRLELRYEVHGGPSACCGILQMRPGDDENAMRQATRTIDRFLDTGAPEVLSWCPTCQIQFGEVSLPVQLNTMTSGTEPLNRSSPGFDMTMFPVFLAGRLASLQPHLTRRVEKRVALHEHPGTEGVVGAVHKLLNAVPGVEIVDLPVPKIGYSLTALAPTPDTMKGLLAKELAAAEKAGVTALVGIYHTEHRELAAHEQHWPFEFLNYLDIIGESMGIAREDVFKRLAAMQSVDAILADCADLIGANGLDPEEARAVISADLVGDQILPLDRREHPKYLVTG